MRLKDTLQAISREGLYPEKSCMIFLSDTGARISVSEVLLKA